MFMLNRSLFCSCCSILLNTRILLLYMHLILLTVASSSVVDDTCNIFLVADFYGYCDIDNGS